MTEEIKARQTAEDKRSAVEFGHAAGTGAASVNGRPEKRKFNHYIYENLVCNIEGQIECWNRKATHESNSDAAQALRQKSEGLGYALRLLFAFKPEFEELVSCASGLTCSGCGSPLEYHAFQLPTDCDLCDSCYEIAHPLPEGSVV